MVGIETVTAFLPESTRAIMDTLQGSAAVSAESTRAVMDNVEVITRMTYVFFVYLVLSLLVERTIEVLVAVYNYSEFKAGKFKRWNRKAETYRGRFDRLYGFQGQGALTLRRRLSWVLWKSLTVAPYEGGKETVSADLIRLNFLRVSARVIAFLIALWLTLDLKLDLVVVLEKAIPEAWLPTFIRKYELVRQLLTAAAISIGSEPLHQIIRNLERRIEKKFETEA